MFESLTKGYLASLTIMFTELPVGDDCICAGIPVSVIILLQGYQLVFCGHASRWQGGVASIEEKGDRDVWGVVWQLDQSDRASLDR